jgi:acetyl-CoA C-acetyltransferase
MTPADPRAPVIVGTGQVTEHPLDGRAPSPLALMEEAARLAAADAGAGEAVLSRAATVAVVDAFSWPVPDPGALLAEALAIRPQETVRSLISGTSPIELLGDLCARIQAGELEAALLTGGEAVNEFGAAMAAGRDTGWPTQPEGTKPSRVVGTDRPPSHEAELAASLIAPIAYYPLLESAVRDAAGADQDDHRRRLGELWARFAAVGAGNPHAWARSFPSAKEIATPGPDNRLVAEPYTKLMTANIQVTQGAALLLCSAATAAAAGVPRERWVYVHASAEASDHWFVAERDLLDRSPAIAACGEAALGHAGAGIDDVARLDLYSCFPSAVQIAATELGIDLATDSRAPTVTGGLTFAGGPGSNYATHSLAAMAEKLREQPDSLGLATAVGWYMTKHAAAVLSGGPPATPFAAHDVQGRVDRLPRREPAADAAGVTAPIEAYTVIHGRGGSATIGTVSCLLDDGRRAFARSDDPDTTVELLAADPLGRSVRLRDGAEFELA